MKTIITVDLEENPWRELVGAVDLHAVVERLGVLPRGMNSGLPSVTAIARLDSGQLVMVEVSLRHFQLAAAAFKGKYPDDGESGGSGWAPSRNVC